jgi:alpha-D-xyloside xylohydrolase
MSLGEVFSATPDGLVCRLNAETIHIQPWGADSVRVRATVARQFRDEALSALIPQADRSADIDIADNRARLTNGRITAEIFIVYPHGEPKQELNIRFLDNRTGQELLSEMRAHFGWPAPRHYEAKSSETWWIEATFKAYDGERFYGLGQRQHGFLDQKGCVLPLLQMNAEVNIPFAVSSRGYGFLWNNPAVGRVELGRSLTRWVAESARQVDYWVTAGSPADILRNYAEAAGRSPPFPEWASGFWQCRLRYRNQEELLSVAREHKRRGLPLSCIVIDFFHWTRQGEWKFDPVAWPNPEAMVKELKSMGVELMVSIWPTVNTNAEDFARMQQEGWLIQAERGLPVFKNFIDTDTGPTFRVPVGFYDSTNPAAREFVLARVKENYFSHGIRAYWLDACEPEARPGHPEIMRLHLGNGLEVLNAYPLFHVRGFHEAMEQAGEKEPMFLCRSAWAGSQRYGAALWSGDIRSTFQSFREQIRAGLNAGLSGIGWWTTDIGGFYDGNGEDPEFRELLVRWFQFGAFCPIFRLHGFRIPEEVAKMKEKPAKPYGKDAVLVFTDTGGPNEVWSWGEEIQGILTHYLLLRERLRPYVMGLMETYSRTGAPPMRPLFFDFPDDPDAAAVEDSYMFGPDLLVAPVLHYQARTRSVYLPAGATWTDVWTGEQWPGGRTIEVDVPLDRIPLFTRDGAKLPIVG